LRFSANLTVIPQNPLEKAEQNRPPPLQPGSRSGLTGRLNGRRSLAKSGRECFNLEIETGVLHGVGLRYTLEPDPDNTGVGSFRSQPAFFLEFRVRSPVSWSFFATRGTHALFLCLYCGPPRIPAFLAQDFISVFPALCCLPQGLYAPVCAKPRGRVPHPFRVFCGKGGSRAFCSAGCPILSAFSAERVGVEPPGPLDRIAAPLLSRAAGRNRAKRHYLDLWRSLNAC
jgi:hypothetical protein